LSAGCVLVIFSSLLNLDFSSKFPVRYHHLAIEKTTPC
jgi:hypothetical protein